LEHPAGGNPYFRKILIGKKGGRKTEGGDENSKTAPARVSIFHNLIISAEWEKVISQQAQYFATRRKALR